MRVTVTVTIGDQRRQIDATPHLSLLNNFLAQGIPIETRCGGKVVGICFRRLRPTSGLGWMGRGSRTLIRAWGAQASQNVKRNFMAGDKKSSDRRPARGKAGQNVGCRRAVQTHLAGVPGWNRGQGVGVGQSG